MQISTKRLTNPFKHNPAGTYFSGKAYFNVSYCNFFCVLVIPFVMRVFNLVFVDRQVTRLLLCYTASKDTKKPVHYRK